jgi:hypothetical protein
VTQQVAVGRVPARGDPGTVKSAPVGCTDDPSGSGSAPSNVRLHTHWRYNCPSYAQASLNLMTESRAKLQHPAVETGYLFAARVCREYCDIHVSAVRREKIQQLDRLRCQAHESASAKPASEGCECAAFSRVTTSQQLSSADGLAETDWMRCDLLVQLRRLGQCGDITIGTSPAFLRRCPRSRSTYRARSIGSRLTRSGAAFSQFGDRHSLLQTGDPGQALFTFMRSGVLEWGATDVGLKNALANSDIKIRARGVREPFLAVIDKLLRAAQRAGTARNRHQRHGSQGVNRWMPRDADLQRQSGQKSINVILDGLRASPA